MNVSQWRWVQGIKRLLSTQQPEPAQQAERIAAMQLHIVLPAKAGVIAVALYYIVYSDLFHEAQSTYKVVLENMQWYLWIYLSCNLVAGLIFGLRKRFPPGLFQWIAFTLGLLDGLFMAGLTFVTGGFNSIVYWIFPGLIVLNAISIPLTVPQIVLNLILSMFYLGASLAELEIRPPEISTPPRAILRPGAAHAAERLNRTNALAVGPSTNPMSAGPSTNRIRIRGIDLPYEMVPEEPTAEPALLRLIVLWLLTACCYGAPLLAERQRRVFEEAREFAVREAHLHSAGRLAAEVAHQIKNPLAIINNAIYSIRRALSEGRYDVARQIQVIQEEVERADRVVTQIMGYAQLSEGHVEKLNVAEEIDRSIDEVFPTAVNDGIRVERSYVKNFPPLLMQRRHFSEIMVNLLQNAREALEGKGEVSVSAVCRPDYSIEVSVRDSGPGIPADKLGRIFEPYYSTRPKGTGLGLAIVKHNVELYAGTVRVESELGKGARFVLTFPEKTVINPEQK
jgi:signal transduction histidine kinase